MLTTALRINWLNLKRDRLALALSFVVPVIFFSVFATIFSSTGGSGSIVRVAILDQAENEYSRPIVAAIRKDKSTFIVKPNSQLLNAIKSEVSEEQLSEKEMEAFVSENKIDLAIVFPKDFQIGFGDTESPMVKIFADTRADPIAYQMINGILQKIVMTEAPQLLMKDGLRLVKQHAGALTPAQEKLAGTVLDFFQQQTEAEESATNKKSDDEGAESSSEPSDSQSADENSFQGLVSTEIIDVREEADKRRNRKNRAAVSFYASGIAVMFLLFSMTGAASGILEEEEMGTLDRVLDSRLGLNGFLLGHWLYTSALGFMQITVMFVWGAVAFGLDLWSPDHLLGFFVVTLFTATAAAAFGMMLGTACRSRAQLNGISTTVVLIMSALGGSMIPRFIMKANNPLMETVGYFTFNAWALDAYENVFWNDKSLWDSRFELTVLCAMVFVFLGLAWKFAQRWNRG